MPPPRIDPVLALSPRITLLPIVHGSGDFALAARQMLLEHAWDCLAVPLPPSFQHAVERAIDHLPAPTIVVQRAESSFSQSWTPESDADAEDDAANEALDASYVPIDPCQGVIAALRVAREERLQRAFIDLETNRYQQHTAILPDPYALKKVSLAHFAAATLPALVRPTQSQILERLTWQAHRLHQLERKHHRILALCSLVDWPWLREAYQQYQAPPHQAGEASAEPRANLPEHEDVAEPTIYQPESRNLLFLLGELPFVTGLYERARAELEEDANLSIDGVKELLLEARDRYLAEMNRRARKITPHLLRQCLKYVRNLTLLERRLTPDLYTLVMAAKQTAGDQFALHVAETARDYPYQQETPFPTIALGIDRARLPNGDVVPLVSRLPGVPVTWRSCELIKRPEKHDQRQWEMAWNPYSQCSWPPEDQAIENFRAHVFDRAKGLLGADLARTEKFTTSFQDGLDIRETLRHWYDGEIYVKVQPPSRGRLDTVIMLFESPADPRDYPYRSTWYSEFAWESTLAFFATDFREQMVGPGIGLATYGGALFIFPPLTIPDVWQDPRLDFADTLDERLVAAGCMHSQCPHVAILSALPPGAGWRRLAKRFGKKLVHLPLGQFSDATIQQLRMMHVLNGKQVRSFAAHFIRKA